MLAPAEVRATRDRIHDMELNQRVMFRVMALYGLSRQSIQMPLNESESIESGQICITLDPDAESGSNVGAIAQLHLYLDDIDPRGIGKPLFGGPVQPASPFSR